MLMDSFGDSFNDWLLENESDPMIDIILLHLLSSSPSSTKESKKGFSKFARRVGLSPDRHSRHIRLLEFSAIGFFLICLLLGTMYHSALHKEVVIEEQQTAWDEIRKIVLDDGSTVQLSYGSKLIYPVPFSHDSRKVFLEGEAYLDISKDQKRPFIVSVGDMEIKVHGTRFNVNSYMSEEIEEIALVNGSVEVHFKNGGQSVFLNKGELLKHNKIVGEIEKNNFAVNYYEHKINDPGLFFHNSSFKEIAEKLSARSGVPIMVLGDQLREERYFASFINGESVYDILNALNFKHQFHITKTEDAIIVSPANPIKH